jgi:acetyl esterase/lipase
MVHINEVAVMEKSRYYEMIKALHTIPSILYVIGNRHRSDFLFVDDTTGAPVLYRWDPDSGRKQVLTPLDKPFPGYVALHNQHPWIAFCRETKEGTHLYTLDYATHETERVSTDPLGYVARVFWDSDDEWIIEESDFKNCYISVLSRKGMNRLFSAHLMGLDTVYDDIRKIVMTTVGEGTGTRIVCINREGTAASISESDTSEDVYPSINPEAGLVVYKTDVSGSTELVVRTIDTLEEVNRIGVPGDVGFMPGFGNICWVDINTLLVGVAHHAQMSFRVLNIPEGTWSDPVSDMSVFVSTSTSEGPLWIASTFDHPPCVQGFKTGKVQTVLKPEYTGDFCPGESHWYTSFDGRKIQGWLFRSSHKRAPVIVSCRGGIDAAVISMWGLEIQMIVKAGYNVFAPNFRGSTTFGLEFKNLKIGDPGGGDVKDILYGAHYAVDVVGTHFVPALVGVSYGGYLVLQALTTQPDSWAGGVAFAPVVDFVEDYRLGGPPAQAGLTYLFDGTLEEKMDLYTDRSPITHLEHLNRPTLVVYGDNDPVCPPQIMEKFRARIEELGLPVIIKVLKGEGHNIARVSSSIEAAVDELEFLKTLFLKG